MATLKSFGQNLGLVSRSDDSLLKGLGDHFRHKCPSHTVGMAAALQQGGNGTDYTVWSLSQ